MSIGDLQGRVSNLVKNRLSKDEIAETIVTLNRLAVDSDPKNRAAIDRMQNEIADHVSRNPSSSASRALREICGNIVSQTQQNERKFNENLGLDESERLTFGYDRLSEVSDLMLAIASEKRSSNGGWAKDLARDFEVEARQLQLEIDDQPELESKNQGLAQEIERLGQRAKIVRGGGLSLFQRSLSSVPTDNGIRNGSGIDSVSGSLQGHINFVDKAPETKEAPPSKISRPDDSLTILKSWIAQKFQAVQNWFRNL
jgi:hypothetical protein